MSAATSSVPTPLGRDRADDLASTALQLARRIATGATLWAVSPTAPAHAEHLAVEFLHPVIMGKRAVPAVAVEGADARAVVRTGARVGDVLVLLGPEHEPELRALARRGAPWGLLTIWFVTDLAVDERLPTVDADHVVRIGTTGDDATVELVLAYHLLWELTHVVFEPPGLLRAEPAGEPDVCVTCSDEGRIAEVQTADVDTASVRCRGASERIAIGLVDGLGIGDLVLVHAGVAIDRIEEAS